MNTSNTNTQDNQIADTSLDLQNKLESSDNQAKQEAQATTQERIDSKADTFKQKALDFARLCVHFAGKAFQILGKVCVRLGEILEQKACYTKPSNKPQ